jgi:hypothetical protein
MWHFIPATSFHPTTAEGGRQGKEAQELMVPVNGTRVGRGEERKRSEGSLNATGTAVFDESAMRRPKGDERRTSRVRVCGRRALGRTWCSQRRSGPYIPLE